MFHNRKLALYYFRYKDSPYYIGSFVAVTLIVAVILLWAVVIPQVYDFFSVNNEIKNTRDRINTLKNNVTYLTSLNGAELDGQLQLAFSALPSEKDFASIIDAINVSAVQSGVLLNDYSVVVGELATPSAGLKEYFTVDLVLTVQGDKASSKAFLKKIHEILPLSQVLTFSLTERSSTMRVSFYFKPFPKGTYKVTQPIGPIPAREASLFNTLTLWRVDGPPEDAVPVNLPPDAELGSPF